MSRPPTEIIPSHLDEQGFWTTPKSTCCGRSFVYLDFETNIYMPWTSEGSGIPIEDLRCAECNSVPVQQADPVGRRIQGQSEESQCPQH